MATTALLETANLPTADLTDEHCRHFFYTGPAHLPTGIIGLERHGEVALLRSLVVAPEARGQSLGSALVRHIEHHARESGVRAFYLLTTTAEEFFARRGYARTPREGAPPSIRASREFADICPASSAFMTKTISGDPV